MAVIRIKNKVNGGGIPSGLTQGELAVNLTDRSLYVGGTVGNSIFISGVQSFNGATGDVLGAGLAGNTFTGLNHFQAGISAAGATIGTLIVHRGISASGGVTFQNNLYVGELLTVVDGMEASGGITFANTVYVGETLSVETDISYNGKLVKGGIPQYTMQSVGTTSDLKNIIGVTTGDVVYVNGPQGWDGLYVLRLNTTNPPFGPIWTRLNGNLPADVNGDGIVDGVDLGFVLGAWGATQDTYGWSGTPLQLGIVDGNNSSFEIKVYGATLGKKTSALKITSNDAVPQIFMKAGTVEMDSDLVVYPVGDYTTTIKQTGFVETGYLHVLGSTAGGKGSTYEGNLLVKGLLTLNGGLSAGCGVTFNCLTHFTAGLSGSGATLGRLVVNSGISAAGGVTFANDIFVSGARIGIGSTGTNNTVFGVAAGAALQASASNNTIMGSAAGDAITTGSGNTVLGSGAAGSLTTGVDNVVIGINSLTSSAASNNTVAIGRNALTNLLSTPSSSSQNVAIGQDAGRYRGTATDTTTQLSGSILIGQDSRPAGNGETNQIVIGTTGRGDGSNTTVIGNSSTTSTRVFGTLSTNGGISAAGATLSGTVFVGATLSMNSNIQLNQNFRIFGGVVDGGVYT